MDQRVGETAQALLDAYTSSLLPPIRNRFDAGDKRAAYAVQQLQISRRIYKGRRLTGRKIALASPAVQQQFGLTGSDFGQLFAHMSYGSGEIISMSRLRLARRSHELGRPLRAGELVMTGALGPMALVQPGNVLHVTIAGIGAVGAQLA
jgi:2-keto-4-pentenoate hydratase